MTKQEERARFLEMAKEYFGDDCLTWPYNTGSNGRAYFYNCGTASLVSRFICEHTYGPAPTPKHEAAHSCGKGHLACIARSHLRWATPQENTDDRKLNGIVLRGEANPSAKLSTENVLEIRRLWPAINQVSLAKRFGVSSNTISEIVRREKWKHV